MGFKYVPISGHNNQLEQPVTGKQFHGGPNVVLCCKSPLNNIIIIPHVPWTLLPLSEPSSGGQDFNHRGPLQLAAAGPTRSVGGGQRDISEAEDQAIFGLSTPWEGTGQQRWS